MNVKSTLKGLNIIISKKDSTPSGLRCHTPLTAGCTGGYLYGSPLGFCKIVDKCYTVEVSDTTGDAMKYNCRAKNN